MTFLFYFLLILFLILSVFLAILILVQESKSLGLGASFGGEGATSLFGTGTADIIKSLTRKCGVAFAILCVLLSFWCAALGKEKPQDSSTNSEWVG